MVGSYSVNWFAWLDRFWDQQMERVMLNRDSLLQHKQTIHSPFLHFFNGTVFHILPHCPLMHTVVLEWTLLHTEGPAQMEQWREADRWGREGQAWSLGCNQTGCRCSAAGLYWLNGWAGVCSCDQACAHGACVWKDVGGCVWVCVCVWLTVTHKSEGKTLTRAWEEANKETFLLY